MDVNKVIHNYDLTFIGAGPSTIMAVLELVKNKYQGKICILDKGKSLKYRQSNEVINGFAGAGCFSDSKLTSALEVGGTIPDLTQEELAFYEDLLLTTLNIFNEKNAPLLNWDSTKFYNTSSTSLTWDTHKTCHVGTDNGRIIYSKIENFFEAQPNIDMWFETEVTDVFSLSNGSYQLALDIPKAIITKNLILATGQKNELPSKVIDKFSLKSKPRAFQLGIRVVDELNPQYLDIIKANYDFKFVKEYSYPNNVNVRVRTFCCNSGNAHVCAEKTNEGFTCFNGHAFKTKDESNNTVNYGIICEITGLPDYYSKEKQIELMRKINTIATWENDNFNNLDEEPVPHRKLLEGFEPIKNYYPEEVIKSLEDFISELNHLVDLSKARYLYPEVKLSGYIPDLNYSTFETKQPHLYMIGDCAVSRGILKASYTGYKMALKFLEEENNEIRDKEL